MKQKRVSGKKRRRKSEKSKRWDTRRDDDDHQEALGSKFVMRKRNKQSNIEGKKYNIS